MGKVKMKFEVASNIIFFEKDDANIVIVSSDRICQKEWIFDCEAKARTAVEGLNKSRYTYGIYGVACIIDQLAIAALIPINLTENPNE